MLPINPSAASTQSGKSRQRGTVTTTGEIGWAPNRTMGISELGLKLNER